MYTEVKEWTTAKERMAIAAKHGVKTRAQVGNILRGTCKNIPLLQDLIERAESNKNAAAALERRAKALVP